MMLEVLKKFEADGNRLSPGDIVDGGGWRNLQRLISSRYVRPAEEAGYNKRIQSAMVDARDLAPSTNQSKRKRGRPPRHPVEV